MDDRKKLEMESAEPQSRSEWRGCLSGRLVFGIGKQDLR